MARHKETRHKINAQAAHPRSRLNYALQANSYTARMNFESSGSSSARRGLGCCVALPATRVSVENARRASETLIVPSAEERRPEKGSSSGERPHCVLRLTRPTWLGFGFGFVLGLGFGFGFGVRVRVS